MISNIISLYSLHITTLHYTSHHFTTHPFTSHHYITSHQTSHHITNQVMAHISKSQKNPIANNPPTANVQYRIDFTEAVHLNGCYQIHVLTNCIFSFHGTKPRHPGCMIARQQRTQLMHLLVELCLKEETNEGLQVLYLWGFN